MRVAVIGGGWAGLAAAVELTAGGAQTTLYEAGRVLGGRARSVHVDGRVLDNGQHILLGAYRDTLALIRRVGADPEVLFERQPLQVLDDSGFRLALPRLPAPLNVAWGLLGAAAVDWPEKLKTAGWMQGVKFRGFRVGREGTVAEWLDAAGQTGRLRRHLWEPLCLAALNTPAERASAQIFANVLRDSLGSRHRADTDLLLPRVPFGELLPEPAAHWLAAHGATLHCGRRIQTVTPQADRVTVDDTSFDAAILAVAPQHLGKLWPAAMAPGEFEPIATVYLQYPAKTNLPFPLINLVGKVGQWVVDRGNGLLACVLSGHGAWEALADAALAAALADQLAAFTAGAAPVWHKTIRERRATFSCRPGLPRTAWATTHRRLFIAGDHSWAEYPATLEGAVRSGLRAARAALAAGTGAT